MGFACGRTEGGEGYGSSAPSPPLLSRWSAQKEKEEEERRGRRRPSGGGGEGPIVSRDEKALTDDVLPKSLLAKKREKEACREFCYEAFKQKKKREKRVALKIKKYLCFHTPVHDSSSAKYDT